MRKHVKGNVSWVGYIDWELESFHGDDYSIMNGSSQNAYLIEEEKTVLIDTVWLPHRFEFVENLEKEIDLKKADKNEIMTEVFKSRAIAVGSPTVSNSYLSSVAGWLEFLKQLKFKNKKAAAFGCMVGAARA